jgi:group I intron endonuclease
MQAYLITNKINNKGYVGITTRSLSRRWYEHRFVANSCGQLLAKAIHKYGEQAFEIKPIASAKTLENLKEIEKELIAQFNTKVPLGYNLTNGGDGVFGFKQSEEQKKRNGDLKRGTKASEETKAKMRIAHSGKNNHFYGKNHTEEAKRKNAKAHFKGTILGINKKLAVVVEMNGPEEIKNLGFHPGHVYSCVTGKQKTHKNFIFKRI